jgi:tetratricopeptide (TPR) repeat protein
MLGCSLAFAIAGGLIAQVPPSPAPDANALEAQIASALKQGHAILAQPDANPAEALPFYGSAWDLADQLTQDASRKASIIEAANRLGELHLALGDSFLAKSSFEKVLSIREGLLKEQPDNIPLQKAVCSSRERIGDLERSLGKRSEAEGCYLQALGIREGLVGQHPDDRDLRRELAANYERMAAFHQSAGLKKTEQNVPMSPDEQPHYASQPEYARAQGYYFQALAIRDALRAQDPSNVEDRRAVVMLHHSLAGLYAYGWEARHRRSHQKAVTEAEAMTKEFPTSPLAWSALMTVHNDDAPKTLAAAEEVVKLEPKNREAWEVVYDVSMRLGRDIQDRRDPGKKRRIVQLPGEPQGAPDPDKIDDYAKAKVFFSRALAAAEAQSKLDRNDRFWVGVACSTLGDLATLQGTPAEAIGHYERTIKVFEQLAQEDPDPSLLRSLEEVKEKLAELRQAAPPTPGKP